MNKTNTYKLTKHTYITYIYIYIYIYITNGSCGDETYLKVETIVVCYTKLFLLV